MPIPDDLRDVFDTVLKATDEGRAKWQMGTSTETLFLNLDDFTVQLRRMDAFKANAAGSGRPMELIILDDNRTRIKDIRLDPGDGDFENLGILFDKARQAAVGDKLSQFKQQLSAKLKV